MEKVNYYLNTVYIPYAISKINKFSKLNHDLKADYNSYLERESFMNSDINSLLKLSVFSSHTFSKYIQLLNESYRHIDHEKSLNKEFLKKLDSTQLVNILQELNQDLNNKYNLLKETLKITETNYTNALNQSIADRLNITTKNFYEPSLSKENLLSKLDYSEYKKIDPVFYNEIHTIYKRLEDKAIELANITYKLMGAKYETLLTLPTYLNVLYQAKSVAIMTASIKASYSDLLSHIENNFTREISSLGKIEFIRSYYNQMNSLETNLISSNKKSFESISKSLYDSLFNKTTGNKDNLSKSADQIKQLISSYGIIDKQNALTSVMKVSPQNLTEIDKHLLRKKLIRSILCKDNKNLLDFLDVLKFNYLQDYNSSSEIDKIALYAYLDEINSKIVKSINL